MSDKHFKTLDDIVFENRNKEYGAYDLRTSERSNLTKSLLFGSLIVFLLVGGIVGYNYAINNSNEEERVVEIELTDVEIPDIPEEIIEDVPPPPPPPEVEVAEIRVVMPEPAPNPPKQETIPPQDDMKDKNLGDKNVDGEKPTSIQMPTTPPAGPPGDGKKPAPAPTGNFTAREVSEMAVYPGCEKFKGKKEELQKCLAQKLNEQLGDQLSDFAETLNDRGESQAVAKLQFVIDKSGKIIQVKPMSGGSAELGRESKTALERIATRLSSSGKTIQPAKLEDGSPVNLVFQLPVRYVVQ